MFHIRLANAIRARVFRLLFARSFARFGKNTLIVAPIAIEGAGRIALGDDVYVAAQTCLAARPLTGDADCGLVIGDGARIGRFNHIYATRRVVIGPKVLTANGVYISDNLHGFVDTERAVLDQPIRQLSDVEIGEGAWLGHNVCVVGARIGRGSVIGANAVVTRDIPDFCIAVGAPAVIVKRFDPTSGAWRPTATDGTFSDGPETASVVDT